MPHHPFTTYEDAARGFGQPVPGVATRALAGVDLEALKLLDECADVLSQAALSEDGIDGDRAMELVDSIGKRFAFAGRVSAWDAYCRLFDLACIATGVNADDEPDLGEELRKLGALRISIEAEVARWVSAGWRGIGFPRIPDDVRAAMVAAIAKRTAGAG